MEEIAETAILRVDICSRNRIEKSFVGDGNAAVFWRDEASDAIKKRRFAGSGRAEQDCDAGRDGEIDVEMK